MAKKKAAAIASTSANLGTGNSARRVSAKSAASTSRGSVTNQQSGSAAFVEAAECLKTIAHPVRLRMIQLLLEGRYTVGELAADCQIPDNVASEHLRLMQRCGFFTSEREGRRVYYQVAELHLKQLMSCIEARFLTP